MNRRNPSDLQRLTGWNPTRKAFRMESPRILIADGLAHVLEALQLLLKNEGFVSEAVTSPAAVVESPKRPNPNDEEFGDDRLIRLLVENRQLPAAYLQQTSLEAVASFAGQASKDDGNLDDLVVFLVRRHVSRLAVCKAGIAEEQRLDGHGGAVAGARNRREHHSL